MCIFLVFSMYIKNKIKIALTMSWNSIFYEAFTADFIHYAKVHVFSGHLNFDYNIFHF